MKTEKENTVLSLDVTSNSILKMSKAGLEKTAFHLQSELDVLTQYEALYKLRFLIDERMKFIKDNAIELFTEKYGGSTTERENGFVVTLKNVNEYEYSEYVQEKEREIKKLQEIIKDKKEYERKNGAKKISTTEQLAFTLK